MHINIYTDGSYNSKVHAYGAGCVIQIEGLENPVELTGSGVDSNWARLRNVAGEILAVVLALNFLDKILISEGSTIRHSVTIYHDYEGLSKWVTKRKDDPNLYEWRAKQNATKAYVNRVLEARKYYDVEFKWVPSHKGIVLNERADILAKESIKI